MALYNALTKPLISRRRRVLSQIIEQHDLSLGLRQHPQRLPKRSLAFPLFQFLVR